jgi:hypothetical protein
MDDFISDKKINEFRDLVNSNSGFVYQTYKTKMERTCGILFAHAWIG